jgi:hypothetical protein
MLSHPNPPVFHGSPNREAPAYIHLFIFVVIHCFSSNEKVSDATRCFPPSARRLVILTSSILMPVGP